MSRIDALTTVPVINYARVEGLADKYVGWMVSLEPRDRQEAVRRLGRQDYCWVGLRRHWIWEREVEGVGHWRLFASKRGLTLELAGAGDPYSNPDGDRAHKLLDDFLRAWG